MKRGPLGLPRPFGKGPFVKNLGGPMDTSPLPEGTPAKRFVEEELDELQEYSPLFGPAEVLMVGGDTGGGEVRGLKIFLREPLVEATNDDPGRYQKVIKFVTAHEWCHFVVGAGYMSARNPTHPYSRDDVRQVWEGLQQDGYLDLSLVDITHQPSAQFQVVADQYPPEIGGSVDTIGDLLEAMFSDNKPVRSDIGHRVGLAVGYLRYPEAMSDIDADLP